MDATENGRLMRDAFDQLANGNGKPFMDRLGEDVRWTIIGTTAWSRTYEGKKAVRDELMRPLFAQFADRYTNRATRIVAEGDVVVIECRGRVATKAGKAYNQTYCYVCRLAEGKVRELTEYLDTEMLSTALDPPEHPETVSVKDAE
jgi:ketosteroid isomerase-like protein